jgi:hypothetical protein
VEDDQVEESSFKESSFEEPSESSSSAGSSTSSRQAGLKRGLILPEAKMTRASFRFISSSIIKVLKHSGEVREMEGVAGVADILKFFFLW